MDPYSALTIASSVVQFVDYGTKLISVFRELLRSEGALTENLELEQLTQDLSNFSEKLTVAPQSGPHLDPTMSKDELAVQRLAHACKEVAKELLALLQDLKVDGRHRKMQSFRQALRSMLKKEKIEQFKNRLDRLQNQINSRLLSILSNQQSSVSSKLNDLAEMNKRLETSTMVKLDQLRIDVVCALQRGPRAATGDDALKALSKKLSILAQEGKKVAVEQNILDSLRFEFMRMRHSIIKDATPKTFEWIHQHPEFSDWLQSQSGTFWIAGKAGSGKSTLMKYLCDHTQTFKALEAWTGSKDFIVLSYYFWSAGNVIQQSQEGLLRSLLYQILRQRPILISEVCPSRMQDQDGLDTDQYPWTQQELSDSFKLLARQNILHTKLCLFIDGLDEYEGEKTDLIKIVEDLATSPNVKICLSSRPWNVFVNAFGQNAKRKLLVQDFTRDDIKRHIEVRLEINPRYVALKKKNCHYQDLILEIVERAQGVFLWVYLVVGSLLRGLEEQDEINDLQRRLELLPKDLEEYFKHIFDAIEDAYQEQTAQIFQISVQAVQPLSVMAFSFLDKELKDPDYALKAEIRRFTDAEIYSTYDQMQTRLNARCKDLLEINEYEGENILFKYRVDFLHRTVRDFLQTKTMQKMLSSRATEHFDARKSLCKIFLAQIKTVPLKLSVAHELNSLFALVDELMYYAGEVERYNKESEVALLDELDRVVSIYADDMPSHWTNSRDPPDGWYEEYEYKTFLASAVQARLRLYVTQKLNKQPRILQEKKGRPLLDYALRPIVVTPIQLPYQINNIDADMVCLLLDKGANPNQKVNIYDWRTVWDLFLLSCHDSSKRQYDPRHNRIYQVAGMLIQRGADPNIKCNTGWTSSTTARYKRSVETEEILGVSEILKKAVSDHEYVQLEALLEEKRLSWKSSVWRMLRWG